MVREYLSSIDTAMLHLDEPTNPMMITAVMVLQSPVDFERLKLTVQDRLLSMRRFRQRLAWSPFGVGRPYWQDDPALDLGYHLRRARLGAQRDEAALQDVVSLLASTPLDLSRPLWQFHLVENYAPCCALILRFHHSLGDGMAIVQVILSLTDSDANAPWPVLRPDRDRSQHTSPLGAALGPVRQGLRATRKASARLARESVSLAARPSRLIDAGLTGRDAALDLSRFLLLKPDPDTSLRGELGMRKRVAWSEEIPLETVQSIRRKLGGTVNDVLLTVVAGALRRYLQNRGEPVDNLSIRVTIPVSMRSPGRKIELGNRVGAVFVTLPISIADPACRLSEVVRRMDGRKASWEGPIFYVALKALGHTPGQMANALINAFSTRATAVMTNVRGPQEQLYLAGSPVEALLPWAPTTGRMGIALSVLSYAGEVRLGVLADEGLVPEPERVVAGFQAEFDALLAQAGAA